MLDGTEHECSGEFLDVVRPERVVMSWRWRGGQEDPNESRVEIALEAVREGTEITFTYLRLLDVRDGPEPRRRGWTGALEAGSEI